VDFDVQTPSAGIKESANDDLMLISEYEVEPICRTRSHCLGSELDDLDQRFAESASIITPITKLEAW